MEERKEENPIYGDHGFRANKRTYSVEEVQEILGVSKAIVYKLIEKNCFKAVRIERSYRIFKKSFDEWLDGPEGEEVLL